MRRRSGLPVLVGAIALLGAGIGLWYATMPYPIGLWWEACRGVPYKSEWPTSESDFATAIHLVEQELGWREIITAARVMGPDKIEINPHFSSVFSSFQ
jgi:hypothetical protein